MKHTFFKLMKVKSWVIASTVIILAACIEKGPEPEPASYVRLYNASPDSPGLDVILNDTKLTNASFDYAEYSGYLNFPVGANNVKFNQFGTTTKLLERNLTTQVDRSYTLFVINTAPQLDVWMLRDSSALATQEKARLRFVNLSIDAGDVDVIVNETNPTNNAILFADRSYKTATQFIEVEPKTYSISVRRKSDGQELATATNLTIDAGRYYTLTARGFASMPVGNNNKTTLHLIIN
jgi:Domain of unknown function (DUF4397)